MLGVGTECVTALLRLDLSPLLTPTFLGSAGAALSGGSVHCCACLFADVSFGCLHSFKADRPSLHFLLETSNSPLNHFLLMNKYPFPSFEWDLGKEKRNGSSSACRVYVEVLIASSLAVEFLNFECPTQLNHYFRSLAFYNCSSCVKCYCLWFVRTLQRAYSKYPVKALCLSG